MIVISLYSGKCDFGDTVEIHGLDNILKSKIYVGQDIIPIRADSEKDLVPFYAHLVGMSASENGIGTFFLSSESYVDIHEKEILGWYQRDAIKYINKCKRKKNTPSFEEYLKIYDNYNKEAKIEIFNRVLNKDMSLDNIHFPMQDYYRKNLYEKMLKVGWDENRAYKWCFGWRRWIESYNK